jgi:hypothetical protein
MEYLILALIVFVFVRYIIPMLDALKEYFDMIIASKINKININIAEKQHKFEKSCEDLEVDVEEEPRVVGFMPPGDTDEVIPEEDDDDLEELEEEDDDGGWINRKQ